MATKKPKSLTPSPTDQLPLPVQLIERRIYLIRSQKVMLSPDLAELYQVPTKALNQAVRRNLDRFPEDFMFQLTNEEFANLKSQIVTSSWGGARRANPYAFTEQGAAMLATVLKSKRAAQMSITIMRAFVKMRELLSHSKEFASRLEKVETHLKTHAGAIGKLYDEVKKLQAPQPLPPKRRIGFTTDDK